MRPGCAVTSYGPPYLDGVESDNGLDEGNDIVQIPPRPIGAGPAHLDVQGFGKAMEAALKDDTAGWHVSATDLLDIMDTFRRKGTIMTPEKAPEMMDNGFGFDAVGKKIPTGKLYGKNGVWHNGDHREERSWIYILPDNMEMVLLVNSTLGGAKEEFLPIAQMYADNCK